MKSLCKALLISFAAAVSVPTQVRAVPVPKPEIKNRALFSDDKNEAVRAFDKMMRGPKQADWDQLILLLHHYPKRFALLMDELNGPERIKIPDANPYRGYSEYLYRRVQASEDFARKSAFAWRVGWKLSCADMMPKLLIKGFPSTRRIALEFLKHASNGETFGYDWKAEPSPQDPAILKWKAWIARNSKAKANDNE